MSRTLHIYDTNHAPKTYDLSPSGLLIGTHALCTIKLEPIAELIAAFQLAVRVSGQGIEVINLSLQASVLLNERPLPLGRPVNWDISQSLKMGNLIVNWQQEAHEPAQVPQAVAVVPTTVVTALEPAQEGSAPPLQSDAVDSHEYNPSPLTPTVGVTPTTSEDPFAELLNGPGTVPIGADPANLTHPFSMTDHINRNPADPLEQLRSKAATDDDQLLSLLK